MATEAVEKIVGECEELVIKERNGSTFTQMQIFNISVPDKPLTNIELVRYARLLKIPDFRGVLQVHCRSIH